MRLRLDDRHPVVSASAWVAPTATVVGDVTLADDVGIWYSAVVRGDLAAITVGAGSNVQDGCALHADPDFPLRVGAGVSIGHNATVHGCTVGDDVLVGMGAVVLNGATIGDGSLVAAGAVVSQGMQVPPRSLVAGVPATVKRELSDAEVEHIRGNARVYAGLARVHARAEPV